VLTALLGILCGSWLVGGTAAFAKSQPPVHCSNPSQTGLCVVHVGSPGHGGGDPSRGGSQGHSPPCADALGDPIPCQRSGLGIWDQGLGCYLRAMTPQPPKASPVWQGHSRGAVYLCTAWPPRTTGISEVWFATPPVARVDPRTLALQAEKQLRLPQPSGHRSPSESQHFQGYPFTYVNLWTWFWTSPGAWRRRSATARAGGVSATVTVTPSRLTFDPGDGSASVSCDGPGRAWTSTDGNGAPSAGGCGYQYRTVGQGPVTSTQSIDWSVTWTASDGTSGQLPDLTTSRSGQLMVLQIQSVVSR
jgi:hypothetical protein